mmetsp:Transcript_51730/g.145784  ORF Transcript_51730/g.145784 Transcript_51730/m.145784 type:complete len:205 (-) Transcript_51730:30-644(-)
MWMLSMDSAVCFEDGSLGKLVSCTNFAPDFWRGLIPPPSSRDICQFAVLKFLGGLSVSLLLTYPCSVPLALLAHMLKSGAAARWCTGLGADLPSSGAPAAPGGLPRRRAPPGWNWNSVWAIDGLAPSPLAWMLSPPLSTPPRSQGLCCCDGPLVPGAPPAMGWISKPIPRSSFDGPRNRPPPPKGRGGEGVLLVSMAILGLQPQ